MLVEQPFVGLRRDTVRFEDVDWHWRRDIPLRYVLVSEEWDGEQTLWARCADADGLFVDPVPRREVLTLVACEPTGRLLKAVEKAVERTGSGAGADLEPVGLGELSVIVDHPDECAPSGYGEHYWDLDDAVVLRSRPSEADPLRVDVVIEAEVTGPRGTREPEEAEIHLRNGPGGAIGHCRRIADLYVDRPARTPRPMRLIGCEPTEQLLSRLVRPRAAGDPVELWALDRTGRVIRADETQTVSMHITESRPSMAGGALIDVSLAQGPMRPPGSAARPVWDAWYEGAPTGRNEWARIPPDGRDEWLRFTSASPGEIPADGTCHLDGRFVTDVAALKCALGEAVAGPGKHFAQCWGVLQGCRCGGDAVPGPFTLVWHDAEIARQALASVSVDAAGELTYFESTVRFLEGLGITVVLR